MSTDTKKQADGSTAGSMGNSTSGAMGNGSMGNNSMGNNSNK